MKKSTILICAALLVVGTVVHGATTHRWSVFAEGPDRGAEFHSYAIQLGDYQCEEIPNDIPLKEMSHGTTKKYTSASRNQVIVTSLTTGPAGAVSTHTPEVCYPASGYRTVREPARESIDLPDGRKASYYVAEFEKRTSTRVERQRVRWAWTSDGTWEAPDRPRLAYLRAGTLYKLYVVTPVTSSNVNQTAEDTPEVRQFVAAAFDQYSGLFAGH